MIAELSLIKDLTDSEEFARAVEAALVQPKSDCLHALRAAVRNGDATKAAFHEGMLSAYEGVFDRLRYFGNSLYSKTIV